MNKLLALALLITGMCGAQVINCPSGFSASGTCGVGNAGSSQAIRYSGAFATFSSPNINLNPSGDVHAGGAAWYAGASPSATTGPGTGTVNVQAFTTTFTFTPNGQNVSFVIQNSNNQGNPTPYYFAGGAGCEGGFFQAFSSPGPGSSNYMFSIELDQYGDNTGSSGTFLYSTAQLYQPQISPCNPNDSGPSYVPATKFSTSPVPMNNPSTTRGSPSTDTFSATIIYDGSTVTLNLFDLTASGTCSPTTSGSCYSQTWSNVSIPGMVGATTGTVGFGSGIGLAAVTDMLIKSWTYTVNTATAYPGTSPFASGGTSAANPTYSPVAGSYSGSQSVAISCSTGSSNICYSLGAANLALPPTVNNTGNCASGTVYTAPVTVASTQTLYAMCGVNILSGGVLTASGLTQGAFTITGGAAINPTAISGKVLMSGKATSN